ncbi:hypothetical protein OMD46_16725 [Pseudomonas sp. MDMC_285]|nr:hypothetical protein [Pseudomonas sp. MDMC_285]
MSEHTIQCWSCGTSTTLNEARAADGYCPECEVEIDLAEYYPKLAEDHDALHAEAEALRAENERLRPLAEDRDQQYDMKVKARQQRDEMRAQMAAARGLLRDANWSMYSSPLCQSGVIERCCCRKCVHGRIDAFLTATPAPEVQAEQGERQEPIGRIGQSHGGTVRFLIWNTEDGSEPPVGTMLYTTPQPGPDVRSLLSADDVRDACANAVSVFTEVTNADQCREVAEYMREVLLAQIAHRPA